MTLKELRQSKGLTQQQCSEYLGMPLRTYQNYERANVNVKSFKYLYMYSKLSQYGHVDENAGILTIEQIKTVCVKVFSEFDVEFCYLFGSYAKGQATETSDVDLFISTQEKGLRFFSLVEELRENLHKKVDALNQDQAANNYALLSEVLKEGVKIYG